MTLKKPYMDPTTIAFTFHRENRNQGLKAAFFAICFILELFLFVYTAVNK